MKVNATAVDQDVLLRRLVDMVNGKLDLQNNISCTLYEVSDTGTANTSFTVAHGLGRVPVGYIANPDRSCSVYDYQRSTWTAQAMTLKCSAANAVVNLVIF